MRAIQFSIIFVLVVFAGVEAKHPLKRNDKSIDEVAVDVYFRDEKADSKPDQIKIEDLPKNGELFEGDIIMDDDIRRTVLGLDEKRSADILSDVGKRKHWKNGVVPYEIDLEISPIINKQIHRAIRILNHYTCIRYVPRRKGDEDYVFFTSNSKGCSSYVGRAGGRQEIHLALGCKRIGTVLHEMMHAIGIIHEQARPDRDKHLKVKFENINSGHASNFYKYKWYNTDNLGTEYNFNSVMHYSNKAFSRNGKTTLVSLYDENLKFGQRKRLSKSDVVQINRLYECKVKYDDSNLLFDMTEEAVMDTKEDREKHGKEIEEEEKEEARRFLKRYS